MDAKTRPQHVQALYNTATMVEVSMPSYKQECEDKAVKAWLIDLRNASHTLAQRRAIDALQYLLVETYKEKRDAIIMEEKTNG